MHILGELLDQVFLFSRQFSSFVEVSLEFLDVGLRREFWGEKEPEDGFGEGFKTPLTRRALLLYFEEVVATIVDAGHRVQFGSLVNHAEHPVHSSHNLVHSDLTDLGVSMFLLESLEDRLLFADFRFEELLQVFGEGSLATLLQN
jgi:hypothetical protein